MERYRFDFGYWYAFSLSVYMMVIVFSVVVPLAPLCGLFFFIFKYFVDKYNFAFAVWKTNSESAGAVAASVVTYMLFTVSFFQFVMSGYFIAIGFRGSAVQVQNISSSASDYLTAITSSRIPNIISSVVQNMTIEETLPKWNPENILMSQGQHLLGLYNSNVSSRYLSPATVSDTGSYVRKPQKVFTVAGSVLLAASILVFIGAVGHSASRTVTERRLSFVSRSSVRVWRKIVNWLVDCGVLSATVGNRLLSPGSLNPPSGIQSKVNPGDPAYTLLQTSYMHPCIRTPNISSMSSEIGGDNHGEEALKNIAHAAS